MIYEVIFYPTSNYLLILGLTDYADNEEDEDQDEDVLNDSINQVDLQV